MLFNHKSWGDSYKGPIGKWTNIRKEDGKLLADAEFDENDELAKLIASKVEGGFLSAASIGFRVVASSEDASVLLPGQSRPTVTKCKILECSIVDIPANSNALALYDDAGNKIDLSNDGDLTRLSAILQPNDNKNTSMKINLKAAYKGLLSFFNLKVEEGKDSVEHELNDDQLSKLNGLAEDVVKLTSERDQANADLTTAKNDLTTAKETIKTLGGKVTEMLTANGIEHKGEDSDEARLATLSATLKEWGKTGAKALKGGTQTKADDLGDDNSNPVLKHSHNQEAIAEYEKYNGKKQ